MVLACGYWFDWLNSYWGTRFEADNKGRDMNLGNNGCQNSLPVPNSCNSRKSCRDGVVSDDFPAGLRVLVVDDDPTCLRILEKMLKKCRYEGMQFLIQTHLLSNSTCSSCWILIQQNSFTFLIYAVFQSLQ